MNEPGVCWHGGPRGGNMLGMRLTNGYDVTETPISGERGAKN
jgi:hypothetical protein